MIFRALIGLLCGTACLVVALSASAQPQARIGGTYAGRYQCNIWNTFDLQVGEAGQGRLQAVATMPVDPREGYGTSVSYMLSGQWDPGSGQFTLTPERWGGRHPPLAAMAALQGRFDPATRHLSGRVTDPFGCTTFEMAAVGGAPLAPLPAGAQVSPLARGPAVAKAAAEPVQWGIEYWDAALEQGRAPRESEPIDDVIDWVKRQGYFCIASYRASWDSSGTQASAMGKVDTRHRMVIECSGNCKGLRYLIMTDSQLFGFGKQQPMPVFELRTTRLGGTHVTWQFRRTADGPPPAVYVHQWAGNGFAYGPGCKAPKSDR